MHGGITLVDSLFVLLVPLAFFFLFFFVSYLP